MLVTLFCMLAAASPGPSRSAATSKGAHAAAPQLPASPAERGASLAAAGRAGEARALLEQAFSESPDDPTVAYNLGVVRAMTGAHREAVDAFESYLVLAPAAENAGDVRAQIGVLKAKLNPIPPAAKDAVRRASELVADGKPEEAREKLDEAIQLAPQWAAPHYSLGVLLESQGKASAAVDELRRFLALGAGNQAPAAEARIAKLAPQVAAEQAQKRGAENQVVADWVRTQLAGAVLLGTDTWRRIEKVEIADCTLTMFASFPGKGSVTVLAPLRAVDPDRSGPNGCSNIPGFGIWLQFNAPVTLRANGERHVGHLGLCELPGWKSGEVDPRFKAAIRQLATACGAVAPTFDEGQGAAGGAPPTAAR